MHTANTGKTKTALSIMGIKAMEARMEDWKSVEKRKREKHNVLMMPNKNPSKEFRNFSNDCKENKIYTYDSETGSQYFQRCYGLDIGDSTIKLTKQQLDTRCSIRFWDDIFQFGYALRYSHHDYSVPVKYVSLLEEYLAWCQRNNGSAGTIRVKRTKMRHFFCFLDGRGIEISDLTAADISEFMTTLCRYHRATIHVFCFEIMPD